MDTKYHIGFEVHTLDRMIGKSFHALYEKENLSKIQNWIIRYLYDHRDQDIYQKDIEAVFHIARSTATGILQGLEKQGYLIRKASSRDARLKHLQLTQKAITLQEDVLHKIEQTEERLIQEISAEELETFQRVLDQMQKNLCPEIPGKCKKLWKKEQ